MIIGPYQILQKPLLILMNPRNMGNSFRLHLEIPFAFISEALWLFFPRIDALPLARILERLNS